MTVGCDKCGLEDTDCHCFFYELEDRMTSLEEGLDELTEVVNRMSEFIKKE